MPEQTEESALDLTYRETLPADVESLFSVRSRTRENAMSRDRLAMLGITADGIVEDMARGRVKGWVCLHDATLVGFCNGDGETGEILVLAVLPEYEGRGIGCRLLAHALDWLQTLQCKTLWLAASSDVNTRAHGFYRSLGWRPNGASLDNGDEILVWEDESSPVPYR